MVSVQPWLNRLASLAPKVAVAAALVVGLLLITLLIRWLARTLKTLRLPMVSLLLTPPSKIHLPSVANDNFFRALHDLLKPIRLLDRACGYQGRIACEIIATKVDGIRFVLRVPKDLAAAIEQQVAGHLPETKVAHIEDPLQLGKHRSEYQRFKQKLHYAFSLQTAERLTLHDPISYLTNAMTKLDVGELMIMQLVIKPINRREVDVLRGQIRRNDDVLNQLGGGFRIGGWLLKRISGVSMGILDLLSSILSPTSIDRYHVTKQDYDASNASGTNSINRYISSFDLELIATIDGKLSQPLFQAELRSIIAVDGKNIARQRSKAVSAALNLSAVSKHQRLLPRRVLSYPGRLMLSAYSKRRLIGLRPKLILSSSELATLFHFPTTSNTKTDNLVTSLSRTLTAPVSLKGTAKLDILLGENDHHGQVTAIGLTAPERERHVYIVGGTGNGKTTMMLYAIAQDISAGKGLTVIDPHGDLADTILRHIPARRMKDVIYLNPDDLTRPIGVNLLELKPGLSGDDLLREKDLITESVISVLRKIFSEDDAGGHRIEYVLRNTIQTALTLEGATLFTIFRLLNNNKYRKVIVKTLEDEDLKNFWNNEIGRAGDYQKVKMAAGITAKIGRFLFSASARRILEQEKSTIDFEEILDSGKILICNFSKGLLGEDTSTLFGTTILAKLQVAALRRARTDYTERKPYHLYVDEFQNFATMSFVQMLSEARKYKLFLTMAEQSTAQQEQQRMVDIILANVGTTICFRTGSPADEQRLLPLFKPYISEGELANLPSYNFYARIAALQSQEPMSGRTVLLSNAGSLVVRNEVIRLSQMQYGTLYFEPTKSQVAAIHEPEQKLFPVSTNSIQQRDAI